MEAWVVDFNQRVVDINHFLYLVLFQSVTQCVT